MTRSTLTARAAAILFLITWVTSVAALPLYGGSALGTELALAGRTSVLVASLLEVILAVAVVGTAVALYPLLRPHGAGTAAGYLAFRGLEASVILVGVVAILPAVARPATTASPGLSTQVVSALHLVHDWTFLVGPGLVNPVTAVLLAMLLLRRRLAPLVVPVLGLVGAVIVAGQNLAVMFGLTKPVPVLAVPLFVWEIGLAITLWVRGIKPLRRVDERVVGSGAVAPS
ncbi:DUF4386 domain-containing protein [Propionibacteriaceae bacterium G1746]|uniref:DUF4386 domain-containing protein n=1 Tax=Aestuariimicrobium sp. G57 TaxID=3418485 RepID=UPI003C219F1C